MAINFGNNTSIIEENNKISVPGRVVQTVYTQFNTATATTTINITTLYTSNPITLTNATNKVLIEYHVEHRIVSQGTNAWNLTFSGIRHTASGTILQYSAQGDYDQNIGHFHAVGIHVPGSVGPHTYNIFGYNYNSGVNYTTDFNSVTQSGGDGLAYIRIMEIA
jgi:hypothetical protein